MRKRINKWLVLGLIVLLLSGCSWRNMWKWFDEMEWERDDEVIRLIDPIVR